MYIYLVVVMDNILEKVKTVLFVIDRTGIECFPASADLRRAAALVVTKGEAAVMDLAMPDGKRQGK